MLHARISEAKKSMLSNVAPAARRLTPEKKLVPEAMTAQSVYGNQAVLRMLSSRIGMASLPNFIGDIEDGIPAFDPAGGSSAPVPMDSGGKKKAASCTDICDRAYADSSLNGGGGGVICDGAKKCPCVFDVSPLTRGLCPDFDKVVMTHEKHHLTDVDCDETKGLHRPPFRDPSKATASECKHRKESIKEMDKLIPGAKGDCKTGMESIRGDLDTWVKANC